MKNNMMIILCLHLIAILIMMHVGRTYGAKPDLLLSIVGVSSIGYILGSLATKTQTYKNKQKDDSQ